MLPYADIRQTHSAVVFFVGDRAYKLKKPVNLGFLDFSTPQARETACRRETELNRRFAPDVYLGVAEVGGPGGCGREHLVVMRRMPADRRLSALIGGRAPVAGPLRPGGADPRRAARRLAAPPGDLRAGQRRRAAEPVDGQLSSRSGRWPARCCGPATSMPRSG